MRRILIVLGAAFGLAAAQHPTGPCAGEALECLMKGNQRFVAGQPANTHEDREWRAALCEGQHPIATVLACSDSRVPPELIFDQGFGDLFVVRLAGNVVDESVEASVEYGVLHAGTNLVLVLGHESCGAVQAALGQRDVHPLPIQSLLKRIAPAHEGATVAEVVEANTLQSVRELRCVPALQREGVQVVGGVYDLDTGEVRLLR